MFKKTTIKVYEHDSLFMTKGTLPFSILIKISETIVIYLFYNDWEVPSSLCLHL